MLQKPRLLLIESPEEDPDDLPKPTWESDMVRFCTEVWEETFQFYRNVGQAMVFTPFVIGAITLGVLDAHRNSR